VKQLGFNPGKGKSTYLNEVDVNKPSVVSISYREARSPESPETRLEFDYFIPELNTVSSKASPG
jgi:hypothetical protein